MGSVAVEKDVFKGAVFMVSANMAFCVMVCLVRYSAGVNAFISTLFRFIVGMGVIGLLAMSGRARLTFVNKQGLLLRGLLGGIAICTGFLSIVKLGVVKSSIIVNLYPIFAAIFSVPLLGERLRPGKILAFAGALGGVLIVLCGTSGTTRFLANIGPYELIALGGTMLAGLSVVLIKQLQETESSSTICFAQCLVGFWIVIVPAGAAPFTLGYTGIIVLVLVGLFAAAGQLIMTEGYRYIPVSTGALFVMTAPVFNIAAGALLFHERFTMATTLGSLLALGSCGLVMWKKDAEKTRE
jgi:drug/metabolite transporter (DMT)-like permease